MLLDDDPARGLGRALAWADRDIAEGHAADELNIVVDDAVAAGHLARRASQFAPAPSVWWADGRSLAPVAALPLGPPTVPSPEAELFAVLLADAGAEVVIEDGVVSGEVLGLEVARVVAGPDGGEVHLEVGVGRYDREASALMHGGLTDAEALDRVIKEVRKHRRPGAVAHPLNRMAPERWLRTLLLREPALVGATALAPLAPVLPRRNLKERSPAPARGDGVVAVCSTGIDLELVPAAADARHVHAADARLVLVVPEADAHPVTRRLAARLDRPAEVVTVRADWRTVGTLV
ncbi:hypothetical protein BH20ACT2_BH20ACT2_11540 [soil metagenome]